MQSPFYRVFSSNKCNRDGSKDEVSAGKKLRSGLKSLPSVSLCKRLTFSDYLVSFVCFSFIQKWIYLLMCFSQFLCLHIFLHHPIEKNQKNGASTPQQLLQLPAVVWQGFPPLHMWGLSRVFVATTLQVRKRSRGRSCALRSEHVHSFTAFPPICRELHLPKCHQLNRKQSV